MNVFLSNGPLVKLIKLQHRASQCPMNYFQTRIVRRENLTVQIGLSPPLTVLHGEYVTVAPYDSKRQRFTTHHVFFLQVMILDIGGKEHHYSFSIMQGNNPYNIFNVLFTKII